MTDLVPNILKTDLQVWCQTNLLEGYQEGLTEQCGGLESTIKSITVWLALHHSRETNPYTIHLRRPWTSTFFRPASRTIGFSLRFKNSGHVITFL